MEIPALDGKQASKISFHKKMILSDLYCAEAQAGLQRHLGCTEQYAQKSQIQKQLALRGQS